MSIKIQRTFNETSQSGSYYRIRVQIYPTSGDITGLSLRASSGSSFQSPQLAVVKVSPNEWNGLDVTTYVQPNYFDLDFEVQYSGGSGTTRYAYFRNIQVMKVENAEVQESELQQAGRRYSSYIGSKLTSADINIDSPDTIDGGPVVYINDVSSFQPGPRPLEGKVITNPPRDFGPLFGKVITNTPFENALNGKVITNTPIRVGPLPTPTTDGKVITNVLDPLDRRGAPTPTTDGKVITNVLDPLNRTMSPTPPTGSTYTPEGKVITNFTQTRNAQ